MLPEYSLIDLGTNLVFGPYPSFNAARHRANKFNRWEIVRDDNETVLDWSEHSVAAPPHFGELRPKSGGLVRAANLRPQAAETRTTLE